MRSTIQKIHDYDLKQDLQHNYGRYKTQQGKTANKGAPLANRTAPLGHALTGSLSSAATSASPRQFHQIRCDQSRAWAGAVTCGC